MVLVCPNSNCKNRASGVIRYGFTSGVVALNGLKRRRYRCKQCRRTFTNNVHSLDFRCKNKDLGLSAKIFLCNVSGLSNRFIGRIFGVSESCVRGRLFKMSAWAFDFHAHKTAQLKIDEAICMDGLENFAGTQYDPNYINQAIGRDSLFIHDFNFSPLNRKGYMSPWQKERLKEIEEKHGRYDGSAIRKSTTQLVQRLFDKRVDGASSLALLSDNHYQYHRSIQIDLKHCKIEHLTISSKACRNYQNILFCVNHADLLIRHQIGAFKRETISFSKTHARMCQRFMLFALFKNYMAPQFTKTHKKRPLAHKQTPAQALGLFSEPLKFHEIFSSQERILSKDAANAHPDWSHFKNDQIPEPGHRSHQHTRRQAKVKAA